MKKIILLLSVIIINARSQDLLELHQNVGILNKQVLSKEMSYNVNLVSMIKNFSGYLILKINNDSKEDRFINGNDTSYTYTIDVYWVDSLSHITIDSEKYFYYNDLEYFVGLHSSLYKLGYTDALNSFCHYLLQFSRANKDKLNIYLVSTYSELKTNILINAPHVYEQVDNADIKYVIYKTQFSTAVLEYNYENKIGKVFLPYSYLGLFEILEPKDNNSNKISLSDFKIIKK
jgi:hypothetical protein